MKESVEAQAVGLELEKVLELEEDWAPVLEGVRALVPEGVLVLVLEEEWALAKETEGSVLELEELGLEQVEVME